MLIRVMKVKHNIKLKQLIAAIALPLAVGGLAAFLTKDGMKLFETMAKPPLAPPQWLFPVAWTALYILMGVASYLIWTAHVSEARRERALTVYALQLAANFLWPVLFFTLGLYFVSFLWLIVLWVMILVCTVLFHYISRTAGKLMLPYLIWTAFAGYLNLGIWLLNRLYKDPEPVNYHGLRVLFLLLRKVLICQDNS